MLRRVTAVHAPKSSIPFARPQITPIAERSARAPSKVGSFVNQVETTKSRLFNTDGKAYRVCMYIWQNMNGLAMYQIVLEGLVTAYFFAGLQSGQFTVAGLHRIFIEGLKLPESWVGLADAHYDEDYRVPGLNKVVPKEKMTNVHTAHNVAMSLLPLQFIVIGVTFPHVKHAWTSNLYPLFMRIPFLSSLLKRPTMPNEFADKVMWATAQKRKDEVARQATMAKPNKKSGFRK